MKDFFLGGGALKQLRNNSISMAKHSLLDSNWLQAEFLIRGSIWRIRAALRRAAETSWTGFIYWGGWNFGRAAGFSLDLELNVSDARAPPRCARDCVVARFICALHTYHNLHEYQEIRNARFLSYFNPF